MAETFQMGKIHKDIAMFMTEAAKDNEYSDQTLIKVKNLTFFNVYISFVGFLYVQNVLLVMVMAKENFD